MKVVYSFPVETTGLKSVKFCSRSGKSQGILVILMCGNTALV